MSELAERAEARRRRAVEILDALRYLERWGRIGRAELAGSVRLGLVVAHDIDVEVVVEELDPTAAFGVAGEIAGDPRVVRVLYRNLTAKRGWLYWEIEVRCEDGDEWTIETYVNGPADPYRGWSVELADALDRVLTEEQREVILALKEALADDEDYRSLDVYRAVVDGGVRTLDAFRAWRVEHGSAELVHWIPAAVTPARTRDR